MSLEIAEEWIGRQTPDVQAVVRMMLARIAELEARLNKSPQNSSLPPSSQHPHAKPPAAKPKSKRNRGGQPGHIKHERPLLPPEQCNQVHTLKPHDCRRCGHRLSGADAEPLRHQVWELPEIRPIVTEYQRHRLTCACCGTSTCAALPPGVSTSQAGPRLTSLTALLMGCFRQSKRRVALFLEQVLGQPCSPGWVVKLQRQATAALRPNWEELAKQLARQDNLGIDETPTKEASRKSWLWDFVAKKFTVFALRPTRAATVLDELLDGKFRGVVNCDRAKMYWCLGRLQWCWAHLKRDFQALVDSPDRKAQRLGHDLLRPTGELFRQWSRYRDGALTRRGFVRSMQGVRTEIESFLLRGAYSGSDALIGMFRVRADSILVEVDRNGSILWRRSVFLDGYPLLPPPAARDNAAMQTEPLKTDPPKRKRRWFQFSLRSLMIGVTLLALPGAYMATQAKIVRARSAWKKRYEWCHFPCIVWGENNYCGADLALVRRWLGDKPVSAVLFEYGVPQDDVDEAKTLFPEAEININLVSPGYCPGSA